MFQRGLAGGEPVHGALLGVQLSLEILQSGGHPALPRLLDNTEIVRVVGVQQAHGLGLERPRELHVKNAGLNVKHKLRP